MVNADYQNILFWLVIVFLVLFIAGLLVYTVFFIIHKVFFRKQWKLMEQYNTIFGTMFGVNFFKIEILKNNNLITDDKFNKIKTQYETINANLAIIFDNLTVLSDEINAYNLKPASAHLKIIRNNLDQTKTNYELFKKEYDKYTAYPDEIENIFQTYLDVFEALDRFYNQRIIYHRDFKTVNALFDNISRIIKAIPETSKRFNYKKTIDILIDLHNKIDSLIRIMFVIMRFQVVQIYLRTSMEKNNKIILANYKTIAASDLPTLQKSINIYKTSYDAFVKAYKQLDLKNAHRNLVLATKALTNLNQFCFINSQTKDLINVSLEDIRSQTENILKNKLNIVQSIDGISSYFVKDEKIGKKFKTISKNLNEIEKLVNDSNKVDLKTHSQKIRALKSLAEISSTIVIKKEEINQNINEINNALSQIISAINDLNDLYIYFCQIQAVVDSLLPNNSDTKILKETIKDNIEAINGFTNQIITEEKPDYNHIASSTVNIINQINQIYKKINSEIVLRTYASKLMTYANRYRANNEKNFGILDKLYKDKEYGKCIDGLIELIKLNK